MKLTVYTTITYYEIKLKKKQNECMTKMRGSGKMVASVESRSQKLLELKIREWGGAGNAEVVNPEKDDWNWDNEDTIVIGNDIFLRRIIEVKIWGTMGNKRVIEREQLQNIQTQWVAKASKWLSILQRIMPKCFGESESEPRSKTLKKRREA